MTRRRKLISIYSRIGRTYWRRAPSLLLLAVTVFVPLGLVDAFAAEANLDGFDFSSGVKVAALIATVSLVTMTSLLGEVFYSGTVAISLTHPEGERPPSLRSIARRLNYGRLIAIDVIYVVLVLLGMIAFIVPGVIVFVMLGLSGPVVEIEGRTVRGALARSWSLVRTSFWVVFWVLVPVEVVGDTIAEGVEGIAHGLLGHTLLSSWLAESLSNIFLAPLFAIAAVLLTLDLIAVKDGADRQAAAATPSPSPA